MATVVDAQPIASRQPDAIRAAEGIEAPSAPSRRTWWLVGAAAWTALVLLSTAQRAMWVAYRGDPVEWGRLLAVRAVDWYTCALFIPLLYWMVRRWPIERRTWPSRGAAYVVATVAAALAKYALLVPLERWLLDNADITFGAVLAGNAISELIAFWAIIGVLHAVEFYQRYREREAQALGLRARLSEAQLQSLRAQIHPHFLFNTLNAATALVHRDADAADAMLTRLADLLRLTLRADATHETTLREEMALLEHYLDIMRVRFADQLAVTCDVPPALEGALVPTFVLQPLVENALEHGVARLDGPGTVEIRAREADGALVLAVRDDGPGHPAYPEVGADDEACEERSLRRPKRNGIGLANTRRRLAELYGERASLELRPLDAGGTEAELRLPLRIAARGAAAGASA